MTLRIEQLTEDLQLEKTAEEHEMEKIAHVVNVVEQGQILNAVGEEMYKIASEIGHEGFAVLAQDTLDLGARFGACLTKTASESGDALSDALEIAEDMNKIASVYAEIADDVQDEEFNKLAEAVINISNELTDEANDLYAEIEKEAADKEKRGFDTRHIWKHRGVGAAAGVAAGAGVGAAIAAKYGFSKSKGAAIGALIGGVGGGGTGDIVSKIRQMKADNKEYGYKHPTLRALTSASQFGEKVRNTSAGSALAQADPIIATYGALSRFVNKKK